MRERVGNRFSTSVHVPNRCLLPVDMLPRKLTGCLRKAKEVRTKESDVGPFPCFSRVLDLYQDSKAGKPVDGITNARSDFDLKVRKLLDENLPGDRLFASYLFPIKSATSKLAKQERLFADIQQGRVDGADHGQVAAEIDRLRRQRREYQHSDVMRFFARLLVSGNSTKLSEFQRVLEEWKQPDITRLSAEEGGLQEQIAKLTLGEAKSARAADLRSRLASTNRLLDEMDLSHEGFLGEVTAVLDIHTDPADQRTALRMLDPSLTVERVRKVCMQQIQAALPQQILMGDPLHIAGSFVGEILCSLGESPADAQRIEGNLKVVSIIGAQSSAKSTLLNFLFGCGFATRAGRCTKGLYASLLTYKAPGGGERFLLVLDSEGLMSVVTRSNVFDQQITLLCLACSHLVIVNHKGEISRTLQNLMEVALWALGELRELKKIRPKIVFVLRDQNEFREEEVHRRMLARMKQALKEAATEANQELHELLDLQEDGVFLMPAAFCMRKEFAERALLLRGKIFEWLEGVDSSSTVEFASLAAWQMHCSSIFGALVNEGATLLDFKGLYEVRMVQKVKELVLSLSSEVVNTPGSGLQNALQTLVENLESSLGGVGSAEDQSVIEDEQARFVRESETARRLHLQILEKKFDEGAASLDAREEILQRFRPQLEAAIDRAVGIATEAANRIVKKARERQRQRSLEQGFQQKLREAGVLLRRPEWHSVAAIQDVRVLEYVQQAERRVLFPNNLDADTFVAKHCNQRVSLNPGTWFSQQAPKPEETAKAFEVFKEEVDCLLDTCQEIEEDELKRIGSGGNPSDMTRQVLEKAYVAAEKTMSHRIPELLRQETSYQIKSKYELLGLTRFSIVAQLAKRRCERRREEREQKRRQLEVEGETRLAEHLDLLRVSRDSLQLANRYAAKLFESTSREVLDASVDSIALRVSARVQAEMPHPRTSCQRAFHVSFERRNLPECIKYILCPDLFVEELFDETWEHCRREKSSGTSLTWLTHAKCIEIAHHRHHRCSNHLLGAFNGAFAGSGVPSLATCDSVETMSSEWRRGGGPYTPFLEHLAEHDPSWVRGFQETVPLEAKVSSEVVKEVWMRTRRFFLDVWRRPDVFPADMRQFDNMTAPVWKLLPPPRYWKHANLGVKGTWALQKWPVHLEQHCLLEQWATWQGSGEPLDKLLPLVMLRQEDHFRIGTALRQALIARRGWNAFMILRHLTSSEPVSDSTVWVDKMVTQAKPASLSSLPLFLRAAFSRTRLTVFRSEGSDLEWFARHAVAGLQEPLKTSQPFAAVLRRGAGALSLD
uniref:VLIG-type G domain-containing protein n=1 Tax=Chromera velia CCMP2878 TaxID=1169474 RepID=A0A0G4I2N0_9ALVE|eukprot:Cvel_10451.t1-p1 / transcript=Cvel_10451.t1 / gene=Cvel_10451 / organism=Chromera_velia_CCMP2878 / gene_product=Interferon-induced very large GTPase 1, putative / transcript_product=Interferon-induced very large GTPase 1, putative / location=Cvel_scaffold629:46631-52270(-) / protein_length=1295 / sequence_SO=supercontig / SO=protein_coding / is_pseudo=false